MALELTGNIIQILPRQSGTGKNGPWVKQDFVIETDEQYSRKVCFSAWGDKAESVGTLKPGVEVKVNFNAESREFNGKWYTDLRLWKLDVINDSQSEKPAEAEHDFGMEPWTQDNNDDEEVNDLPF